MIIKLTPKSFEILNKHNSKKFILTNAPRRINANILFLIFIRAIFFTHHLAIVYGDHLQELIDFGKIMGFGLKVIGITGSAGKTTTKDMLFSILKQKGATIASYKNIDPIFNIPTTILKCRPSTRYLILEMGVEYLGEMDFYLWLAKPDVGIITNVYPTHTLYFKSIEGVAREKLKLAKNIKKDGFVVLNKKNLYLKKVGEKLDTRVYWFNVPQSKVAGIEITEDFKNKVRLIIDGKRIETKLGVVGEQFAMNALAASLTAKRLGCSKKQIINGLNSFVPQEHRMKIFKHKKTGAVIIDDTYNNNPEAAMAAFKTLKNLSGNNKRIVVFGDMLELGDLEEREHRRLGKEVMKLSPELVIGVGNTSRYFTEEVKKKLGKQRVIWVKNWKDVKVKLHPYLKDGSYILLKGSRSIGLDNVVSSL